MVIVRVLFSLIIIGAAIYWYFNPDSHMEPIIIIISSVLVLIASFNHWFARKKSNENSVKEREVLINIISPKIRCYREWIDYGIKIDFELFFGKKVLIKSIKLKYKEPLGLGEKWEQRADLYFVELDHEDLLAQDLAQMEQSLKEKPDLGFITNETSLHIPTAIKLANQGMDLFIEKPLSDSMKNIKKLKKNL